MNTLLSEIELFMQTHGLSATKFGELALNDRHFVKALRNGREIRSRTMGKVKTFMLTYRAEQKEAA